MRLIVLCWRHGKTNKDRFCARGAGSATGGPSARRSAIAHGSGRPVARFGQADFESHGQGAGRWARDGGSAASRPSAVQGRCSGSTAAVGWAAAGTDGLGGGAGLLGNLATQGGARRVSGGDANARSSGGESGPSGKALGDVSFAGTTPLAQGGPRYPTSPSPTLRAGRMEKKRFPRSWRPC